MKGTKVRRLKGKVLPNYGLMKLFNYPSAFKKTEAMSCSLGNILHVSPAIASVCIHLNLDSDINPYMAESQTEE